MAEHSMRLAGRVAGITAFGIALLSAWLAPAGASAGYVNYPDFSSTQGLELNGAAFADEGTLRLTNGSSQTGSAFTKPSVIDPDEKIRASFEFHMHDGGGDGFTFAIQRDPRGADALGDAGGALGYGDGSPLGIQKSVAVEFDIYPDNAIFDDHVAILKNGVVSENGQDAQITPVLADIYGGTRYAWVDYKPKTKNLSVFVGMTPVKPASPTTSAPINLRKELGGSAARAGFTGATGGESVTSDIQSWKVLN